MLPENPNFYYTIGPTSNGYNSLNIKSKSYKIYVQIESQDVYFSMKQTLLKTSFRFKSYDENSEQRSFFSIIFKTIWILLSCDDFWNNQDNFNYPL